MSKGSKFKSLGLWKFLKVISRKIHKWTHSFLLHTYLVLMVNFLIHISYVRWRKGHGCCGRRNRRRQVKAGLIRVVPRFRSTAASCVTAICAGIFRWKNRIWTKLSGKHGMGLKIFITCLMTRWGIWRCLNEAWKVLKLEVLKPYLGPCYSVTN